VVGVDIEVLEVDYDGDERRGLVARCRRAGGVHAVSLLDVSPIGPITLSTRELLDAYRRWSSAEPLPARRHPVGCAVGVPEVHSS
jgi:hypothetical protein